MKKSPLCLAATAAGALALTPLPTVAASSVTLPSYLDLYYVAMADVEVNDFEFDDGDGFGAKAHLVLPGDLLFLTGEYQNNEYDPFKRSTTDVLGGVTDTRYEIEVETLRAGLGMHFAQTPFYIRGEYIGYEGEVSTTGNETDEETIGEDQDEDGYGVHAGIDGMFSEALGLYAQVGYVDIGDVGNGFEGLVGASLSFGSALGVFVDYRYSDLEKKDSTTEVSDARVGLRLLF